MFNIINHQGNANQNHGEISPNSQKITNVSEVVEKLEPLHSVGENVYIAPWKTIFRFLKTLKVGMPLLFSCSVMSSSLRPQGLQLAKLPCSSLFPRICSNSCLLSP